MKKYLEIKQIKAYTFTNLVGNVGGYIGLFLGYAILNTPKLGRKLFNVAKKTIRILKSTSTSSSNDALDEMVYIKKFEWNRPRGNLCL